jgi:hypothetical protein
MKSTILKIIVKEWFKDRLGGELDDGVLEAIIKELTEKKDNRITITDIEPKSNRIHYESEKDAEANKESDWISVNDRMPEENEHQCSEDVLIHYSLGLISIGFTHKGFWQNEKGERNIEDVRNWKPLPKPPKNK